jgi:hypothetical protein
MISSFLVLKEMLSLFLHLASLHINNQGGISLLHDKLFGTVIFCSFVYDDYSSSFYLDLNKAYFKFMHLFW